MRLSPADLPLQTVSSIVVCPLFCTIFQRQSDGRQDKKVCWSLMIWFFEKKSKKYFFIVFDFALLWLFKHFFWVLVKYVESISKFLFFSWTVSFFYLGAHVIALFFTPYLIGQVAPTLQIYAHTLQLHLKQSLYRVRAIREMCLASKVSSASICLFALIKRGFRQNALIHTDLVHMPFSNGVYQLKYPFIYSSV